MSSVALIVLARHMTEESQRDEFQRLVLPAAAGSCANMGENLLPILD
jgi:hypothetical protein